MANSGGIRTIYNEGRVQGLSNYELFIRNLLADNPDASIPTEKEWLAASIARGSSMILKVDTDTTIDDKYTLTGNDLYIVDKSVNGSIIYKGTLKYDSSERVVGVNTSKNVSIYDESIYDSMSSDIVFTYINGTLCLVTQTYADKRTDVSVYMTTEGLIQSFFTYSDASGDINNPIFIMMDKPIDESLGKSIGGKNYKGLISDDDFSRLDFFIIDSDEETSGYNFDDEGDLTIDYEPVFYKDIPLPKTSSLIAASFIMGSYFLGECEVDEDGWAVQVNSYGLGLANYLQRHPVTSTTVDSSKYPTRNLHKLTGEQQRQMMQYIKIMDGMVIMPGEWGVSGHDEPYMDLMEPAFGKAPTLRLIFNDEITEPFYIMFTGFAYTPFLKEVTGYGGGSTNPINPENGDFLGPAVFPWANKILFTYPPILMYYILRMMGASNNFLRASHDSNSTSMVLTPSRLHNMSSEYITVKQPDTAGGPFGLYFSADNLVKLAEVVQRIIAGGPSAVEDTEDMTGWNTEPIINDTGKSAGSFGSADKSTSNESVAIQPGTTSEAIPQDPDYDPTDDDDDTSTGDEPSQSDDQDDPSPDPGEDESDATGDLF